MKTYLFIGASSVIAKSLAKSLLEQGNRIIALSRTQPSWNFTKFYPINLLEQIELPKIDESIDGLVYFPGSINLKPFKNLKAINFQSDFQLNVQGAIASIQTYLPNLSLSENASIVLFSTVAVQTGMPFHSSVAVSKGAIEGLTRALAAEFAPKIRVNCVAPSLTNTPMADRLLNSPEKMEASSNRHPLKKVGKPSDIANMVEFLLSEKSQWITGQILHVDGGLGNLKTN